MGSAIVACGLWKTFESGGTRADAIAGVDLRVSPDEFVALVGPNGSGKSTLLQIIAGLVPPDAGSAWIGDVDVHALAEADAVRFRRRHLGLVLPGARLVPTLSVAENLALVVRGGGERPGDLQEIVHFLGLAEHLGRLPSRLSSGEQQRAAIARALVGRRPVILADEPTGNLDRRMSERLLSRLREQCDSRVATILLAGHDPRLPSYADRIVVLRRGRIDDDVPARRFGSSR